MDTQRSALRVDELDSQTLDLLPARETLWSLVNVQVMPIVGVNLSLAFNAASIGANASSFAGQQILAPH